MTDLLCNFPIMGFCGSTRALGQAIPEWGDEQVPALSAARAVRAACRAPQGLLVKHHVPPHSQPSIAAPLPTQLLKHKLNTFHWVSSQP